MCFLTLKVDKYLLDALHSSYWSGHMLGLPLVESLCQSEWNSYQLCLSPECPESHVICMLLQEVKILSIFLLDFLETQIFDYKLQVGGQGDSRCSIFVNFTLPHLVCMESELSTQNTWILCRV